ncbi:hypothetical protein BDY17DRAFT_293374 [Neohortaea acidophila]|uniref:Calponin-homology (CH) domain-containing protein n=1 Tax=Neohortaea acidophila TaxID=245834 RepID=A0A6A6Q1K8_9PEZI|nr:uncharacterized protein BDY17DRAFT_293374 [Neohortaea acidophila]KAF2485327.1 hypothetical protein BDY17DRAFT_293374 [Neohortaea acidophila]
MASVSSLDQDMRNLRMSRYTPQAAKEVRTWIEETLGESLPSGDLLEALKDGVALCKLVNLVMSPGVKYKSSPMPFIQMENISHFLRACEMPPLSMPAHDRFLTVDLYEGKDPAQVLQCLSAFSRQAHAARPTAIRSTIGPKKASGIASPATVGGAATNGSGSWNSGATFARPPSPVKFSSATSDSTRAMSPSLTGGSSGPVSSWSNRSDEGVTAPAWNIHQYGYMGGASQGNQGISFGARRQITSQGPAVPSLAEKTRLRNEKAAEEERRRREEEEAQLRRQRELEAAEERAKLDEEAKWESETQRLREEERRHIEEQKMQWAEQERRWKEEEEARRREDAETQRLQKKPPEKPRVSSSSILRGQTLSQYQREQAAQGGNAAAAIETPEQKRVRELEKQLEEAREREKQYQAEREERLRSGGDRSRGSATPTSSRPETRESEQSWTADDREHTANGVSAGTSASRLAPLSDNDAPSFSRSQFQTDGAPDLPQQLQPSIPQAMQPSDSLNSLPSIQAGSAPTSSPLGSHNRPVPTPNKEHQSYLPDSPQTLNRTDAFLSTNPAPAAQGPRISSSQEAGDASLEQSRDRDSRLASQQKTKAGNWASKSLLEREMERERERQREWEASQAELKDRSRDPNQGVGEGQSWDVNQYGYIGGDSMNRGSSAGSGINFGGRRQILGPREMGSKPR